MSREQKKQEKKQSKDGSDLRRHPRVSLEVLVQVKSDNIDAFKAVHAKNISMGGMFIATQPSGPPLARSVGAEIFFQFTVKDGGTLIEGLAKVVHSSAAGLGLEFVSVLEPSRTIIKALVDERLRQSA